MRLCGTLSSQEAISLRILAFETSAKAASVAILQDGVLLGEAYQNNGQTHSRTIMKLAEDLLANLDLRTEDVDAVAVAAGPGSFTGVRIGVAAAKGFAWGASLPLYGVSTLEAMAYSAGMRGGLLCCAMDARRNQIYHARFRAVEGRLVRLCEDCAISVAELGEVLRRENGEKIMVGDGASLCYNTLREAVPELVLLPEYTRQQRASGVALAAMEMARRGAACDPAALQPNYLRLSQAERERLERQRKEE